MARKAASFNFNSLSSRREALATGGGGTLLSRWPALQEAGALGGRFDMGG